MKENEEKRGKTRKWSPRLATKLYTEVSRDSHVFFYFSGHSVPASWSLHIWISGIEQNSFEVFFVIFKNFSPFVTPILTELPEFEVYLCAVGGNPTTPKPYCTPKCHGLGLVFPSYRPGSRLLTQRLSSAKLYDVFRSISLIYCTILLWVVSQLSTDEVAFRSISQ